MSGKDIEGSRVWRVAGPATVDNNGTNEIYLPTSLVETAEIFQPEVEKVHWYYEEGAGYHLIGNTRLKQSKPQGNQRGGIEPKFYEHVEPSTKLAEVVSESDDEQRVTSYRNVVPKRFFQDFVGQTGARDPVPEKARMEYGATYYCIYHDEMVEGETRTCYLLSRDELEKVIPSGAETAFDQEDEDDEALRPLVANPRFSS